MDLCHGGGKGCRISRHGVAGWFVRVGIHFQLNELEFVMAIEWDI